MIYVICKCHPCSHTETFTFLSSLIHSSWEVLVNTLPDLGSSPNDHSLDTKQASDIFTDTLLCLWPLSLFSLRSGLPNQEVCLSQSPDLNLLIKITSTTGVWRWLVCFCVISCSWAYPFWIYYVFFCLGCDLDFPHLFFFCCCLMRFIKVRPGVCV